jgi:hypothetical protein
MGSEVPADDGSLAFEMMKPGFFPSFFPGIFFIPRKKDSSFKGGRMVKK